jgi:hypothetical protein
MSTSGSAGSALESGWSRSCKRALAMLTEKGTDPQYESLRNPPDAHCVECRENLLALWQLSAPYLDGNLGKRAQSNLHAAYWEMQLAAGLLQAGVRLTPRNQRTPRNEGPDIRSEDPFSWIEAVAFEAGSGKDAVPARPDRAVYSVPDDQIILRITAAVRVKRDKRETYLRRGWLRDSDPYVIAVNTGGVPNGTSELALPRIVRAVFPIGHYTIPVTDTGDLGDGHYEHRALITKASGSCVSTALFEDPAYAGASACLYSTHNAFNPASQAHRGFVLVHNPMATARLDRGTLQGIREYWREGDELHWTSP